MGMEEASSPSDGAINTVGNGKADSFVPALKTSDLTSVQTLVKPDAEKYFVERSESTENLPRLPALSESLNTAFDEKSLFPKYILDFEMKMKNHHNTVMNQVLQKSRSFKTNFSNVMQLSQGTTVSPRRKFVQKLKPLPTK